MTHWNALGLVALAVIFYRIAGIPMPRTCLTP
jgi:hypothetical protein